MVCARTPGAGGDVLFRKGVAEPGVNAVVYFLETLVLEVGDDDMLFAGLGRLLGVEQRVDRHPQVQARNDFGRDVQPA